jgi:hypothetical protein
MTCDLPQPAPRIHDPDDIDYNRYLLEKGDPYWLGNLEARCRYALAQAGFEVIKLLVNTDDTHVAFSARRAQHAQPVTVEEARASLRQALIGAGCRFLDGDLSLVVDDGHWEGAYAPTPPEDDFDPMDYIGQLPPVPED